MRELRPRLWYWTARHPEWTPDKGGPEGWEQEVGCYAYVSLEDPRRGCALGDLVAGGCVIGNPLPAGVEALPAVGGEPYEVAFRVPEHDAVIVGDALAAAPGAPVRVWYGDESLRVLLDRPLELLLLTHGEPVLEGGGEALARALEA